MRPMTAQRQLPYPMASPIPIPPTIAQLTGPILLGHLFNWGLFGALSVQTYLYYLSFPNDRPLPKFLLGFIYTIEVLQTVLTTRDAFRNFGTGWGDMIDLNDVGWIWFSVPVMSSIISCTTQMFYSWRIYILCKKPWLSMIIAVFSIAQAVAGIACGSAAHHLGKFSEVQHHTYKPTIVWLGGTAICDIIIAGSMMYYLSKSRSGFRSTNLLIAKFIRVTVETGLICAAFAVLDLSFFLRFQDNNYHLAPAIALSKLYSNSLLAVLNARVRIVGGRGISTTVNEDASLSYAGSTLTNSTELVKRFPKASSRVRSPAINVSVHRSQAADDTLDIDNTKFHHIDSATDMA